jgi:hypothetical protein
MKPAPTTARLWTVRTYQQQGATEPPILAHMSRSGQRYVLRLDGPATDDLEIAAVRTGGQWLHLLPGSSPRRTGTTAEFVATGQDLTLAMPRRLDLGDVLERRYEYVYPGYEAAIRQPPAGLMLHLGGAHARGQAYEALSNSDQWAVVYLTWSDQTPLIGSDVGQAFNTTWVCRIAVPIEIPGVPR